MVIALTSNTLTVTQTPNESGTGVTQTGYIGYKVYDQYGNDITTSPLASNIQWSDGFGTTPTDPNREGVLVVPGPTNGMLMTQFSTVVISGIDTNSATTVNQTVNISMNQGTLSNITLNSLISPDNAILTADSTDTFYIDYTATDLSGNDTKDYTLVKNGLMNSNADPTNNNVQLYTSSNYITAQVVPDPNDDTKAAIQVTVNSDAVENAPLMADMPITITAIPVSGTGSSQLTVTLKKGAQLDTFTMMAPTTDVAAGETVNIPFVAYDQNGNQLVNYTDIKPYVTITSSLPTTSEIVENADGTASLQVIIPSDLSQTTTYTLQAVTKTGKFSTLNITAQVAAVPTTLKLGSPTRYMEYGTNQSWDANDIFTVQDQYGRTIDLTNGNVYGGAHYLAHYFITAKSNNEDYIKVNEAKNEAYNGNTIEIDATNTKGSATVTFSLIKDDGKTQTVLDSKTATFTVVDPTDVVGYTLGDMGTIYNTGKAYNTNSYYNDFRANPSVSGKLANGASVVVNDPIVSANSNDTEINAIINGQDDIYVYGNGGDDGRNATITVVVQNKGNGKYYSASNTVKASTAAPVAQSMGYNTPSNQGVTVDSSTNTIKVKSANFDFSALYGKQITEWYNYSNSNDASINLYAVDQYGKNDAPISNIQVLNCSPISTSDNTPFVSIGANNTLQFARPVVDGDFITLQAATTNGKIETVRIDFVGDDKSGVPAVTTATPVITNTPTATDTSVNGTAVAGASITLTVTDTTNGTKTYTYTTTADSNGNWTVNIPASDFASGLVSGDTISVTAQATGYLVSTPATATVQ